MIKCTSISGGRTSAYLAANYPTEYNVFALVRIEDKDCRFPDEKIRREVEDRLQAPFIGTAEYDDIIYTILDLEQYLGREIKWVTGLTYDEVIRTKGGWLPNHMHRYCTHWMKLVPIYEWWRETFTEPIGMQIGYRSSQKEIKRANRMKKKMVNGVLEFKDGSKNVPWQIPSFPLIENGILAHDIAGYWQDKPVRFADYNNCVGCFHRSPGFLRYMYQVQERKMKWFEKQEEGREHGVFKWPYKYKNISKIARNTTFTGEDFTSCDAGYCGL